MELLTSGASFWPVEVVTAGSEALAEGLALDEVEELSAGAPMWDSLAFIASIMRQ